MSLAEVTAQLRQKDSEKTSIEEEIESIHNLVELGFIGKLRVSVLDINTKKEISSSPSVSYTISPSDCAQESVHANKGLGQEICTSLRSQEGSVEISFCDRCFPVAADEPANAGVQYVATLNIYDLPVEYEFRADLETAAQDGAAAMSFHTKASLDSYENLLASKKLELAQVVQHIQEISGVIKSIGKSKSAGGGGKKGTKDKDKKPKKKSSSSSAATRAMPSRSSNDLQTTADESAVGGGSEEEGGNTSVAGGVLAVGAGLVDRVKNYSMMAISLAIDKRAVWLFAVAAGGIYFYGEKISI